MIWGIPIVIGMRCVNCGHTQTPPENQIFLLDVAHIHFPCPDCGETLWSGVPASEAYPSEGSTE